MTCELHTLLFTEQPARAQLVQLQAAWQRIIQNHNYPPAVRQMLGELVAASALLSASLKFNGSLVLQIKGDGPVGLMVAECSSDLGLRATAVFDRDYQYDDGMTYQSLVNTGGQGRFVIILDPRDRLPGQQPYQGIIALDGDTLAQTIESYMQQSEQLVTRLWLSSSVSHAAGLLLQQMPEDGGVLTHTPLASTPTTDADREDAWPRLITLSETLQAEELLGTTPGTLAHRLFWQEPHQTLSVRTPVFKCGCSREKVANMLRSLGEAEVNDAIKEQGNVDVNCDYCNTRYLFDAVDCRALFVEGSGNSASAPTGGSSIH